MNKIYCFSNVVGGGEGAAYAIGDDGVILGWHICSNEGFAYGDLGVMAGSRPDRHKDYKKHFPDGYEMEFVHSSKIDSHEGLQKAIELNKKLAEKVEAK